MKTIVRVGGEESKLAPFASAMLADAFARKNLPEGVLVVEHAQGKPVYIVVSPNPPEIVHGDRRVWGVFAASAQEPIATFALEDDANRWSTNSEMPDTVVREIDSTDKVHVRVGVAIVIKRRGTESTLYARLTSNKQWTIPEVLLNLGESVDGAARRAARELVGIEIDSTQIPHKVPYVNAWVPEVGHFMSIVLIAECDAEVEPEIKGTIYDALEWRPAGDPPEPHFLTMRAIRMIAKPTDAAISDEPKPAVPRRPERKAQRRVRRRQQRRSRG